MIDFFQNYATLEYLHVCKYAFYISLFVVTQFDFTYKTLPSVYTFVDILGCETHFANVPLETGTNINGMPLCFKENIIHHL